MRTLPITEPWFSMILSGEKKEEYREIKPYYDARLPKEFGMFLDGHVLVPGHTFPPQDSSTRPVLFRNGYGKERPSFVAECSLSIKTGKEEWGAEAGKEYYTLAIHTVTEKQNTIKNQGK
jgi:hypothetical protein